MRKWVVILEGALGDESVLRNRFKALEESGDVYRLSPFPPLETPEALYLGMHPSEGQMSQGPLTVAGLGADPPDRSTQFAVTPLSLIANQLTWHPEEPLAVEELNTIHKVAERLNAKRFTYVKGKGREGGLVWEELHGLQCERPSELGEKALNEVLPVGEKDEILRRWIDDSINLLFEEDFNRRRIDAGKVPFNVLWPWGPGMRFRVPQLTIMRGQPAMVMGSTLRLAGLSRLVGYRSADPDSFPTGVNTPFVKFLDHGAKWGRGVIVLSEPGQFRRPDQLEQLDWWMDTFSRKFALNYIEEAEAEDELLVVALGTGLGLALHWRKGENLGSGQPFDERVLEDRRLPVRDLHDVVDAMLR